MSAAVAQELVTDWRRPEYSLSLRERAKITHPYMLAFDWRNPDYLPILQKRADMMKAMDADPTLVADLRGYYRTHKLDFISDWGITVDPRVGGPGSNRSPLMPFILMPRQREWLLWMDDRAAGQEPGVTAKSRDCGLSWLAGTWAVSTCVFWPNVNIGFGSAKEDKVDRSGDPDCLFYKMRMFLRYLPRHFKYGWNLKQNSQHMRLTFPWHDSTIVGEAGDNIGRGGRSLVYFVDESAHVERPKLIDASLAANTDCRQDISSVNGTANSFAERAFNNNIPQFIFHWRDDPRKDDAWAKRKQAEIDPVVWAAEYEINFTASVDGVIIPQTWVQASLDLDKRLGLPAPTGPRIGSLDISDLGKDKCALCRSHGYLIEDVTSWRGNGLIDGREWEIGDTIGRTIQYAVAERLERIYYDADGLGAGAREPIRRANEARAAQRMAPVVFRPWRGSGAIIDPEKFAPATENKNKDYFENAKAQGWWSLRQAFRASYALLLYWEEHKRLPPNLKLDDIIVIRDGTPEVRTLCRELSQPVWKPSKLGKWMVDKTPDDVSSPNDADSVMMARAPRQLQVVVRRHHLESTGHDHSDPRQ